MGTLVHGLLERRLQQATESKIRRQAIISMIEHDNQIALKVQPFSFMPYGFMLKIVIPFSSVLVSVT